MRVTAFEYTASNSIHSTASSGESGSITRETRKCLFLAIGFTAVHLVSSSFLGCKGVMGRGHFVEIACNFNCSKDTVSSALTWVASRCTGGATPADRASFQRTAHRHHRSPGLSPANRYSGRGVIRSFPRASEYARNSGVILAQTTWVPWSFSSVWQQPSRKNPDNGA